MGAAAGMTQWPRPLLCLAQVPFPPSFHVHVQRSGCAPQTAHVPLLTRNVFLQLGHVTRARCSNGVPTGTWGLLSLHLIWPHGHLNGYAPLEVDMLVKPIGLGELCLLGAVVWVLCRLVLCWLAPCVLPLHIAILNRESIEGLVVAVPLVRLNNGVLSYLPRG